VLGPATAKAQEDAQVVKERIDVVIADLDAVQGAVGTASPSGARWIRRSTVARYSFQAGSSLNAAGINFRRSRPPRLSTETMSPPRN
jgi:hypothetical protein